MGGRVANVIQIGSGSPRRQLPRIAFRRPGPCRRGRILRAALDKRSMRLASLSKPSKVTRDFLVHLGEDDVQPRIRVKPSDDEWSVKQRGLLAGDAWIADGNSPRSSISARSERTRCRPR